MDPQYIETDPKDPADATASPAVEQITQDAEMGNTTPMSPRTPTTEPEEEGSMFSTPPMSLSATRLAAAARIAPSSALSYADKARAKFHFGSTQETTELRGEPMEEDQENTYSDPRAFAEANPEGSTSQKESSDVGLERSIYAPNAETASVGTAAAAHETDDAKSIEALLGHIQERLNAGEIDSSQYKEEVTAALKS